MKRVLLLTVLLGLASCADSGVYLNDQLSGDYTVTSLTIEKPEETLVFTPGVSMLPCRMVFTDTAVLFYDYYNDQWNYSGDSKLIYKNDVLVKVGCRTVTDYSSSHITWRQDDWLITRELQ